VGAGFVGKFMDDVDLANFEGFFQMRVALGCVSGDIVFKKMEMKPESVLA
jgi:hypothetical protein